MSSILKQLQQQFSLALVAAFGEEFATTDPLLAPTNNPKFGDYQANLAMSLAKPLKQKPRDIAAKLIEALDVSDWCFPPEIAGPGFINLRLKPEFLESQLQQMQGSDRLGIAPTPNPETVVVDFSSPNIAKEMHVGHLRSTIIGDAIARVLEFQGHDVRRLNHVGDWGTQFGMLIAYLKEVYPNALTEADALEIGDLVSFYKQAKIRFDEDSQFQETARNNVVKLQSGDAETRQAWKLLCDQSRREFQKIYDRLDVELNERGESFYNDQLPQVVQDLKDCGLLVEDQGAQCVFLEGYQNKEGKPQPLIIQKSNGGYNYATTDLAALRYRIQEDGATRIIYVVDAGQGTHFAQVFQVAQRAGWLPETVEAVHVPFGLVQGEDGKKLKTRAGETVRLKDLLDEAVNRARVDLQTRIETEERSETPEFIEQVAEGVGISSVKYADLSQNRTSNYVFSYDKMLSLQGNTAPYLLYAYVRVQGISRKGNIEFESLKDSQLTLSEETELALAKHLLSLSEILDEVAQELLPNRLCQYLFELSQKFNQFYDQCPVLQVEEPLRTSRLLLCDLSARTLKLGLSLLGITVLERM
ncbi:MAG: arginine--tRNA ligase [Phormidium sp. GEM2.Bin31]|nr:MAG: arginine--tRNA ligase [Phormidium sp. GEM2.Bin31]